MMIKRLLLVIYPLLVASNVLGQNWAAIKIDKVPQKHPMWCYAACAEMYLKFYGNRVSQEQVVNQLNGKNDCNLVVDCPKDINSLANDKNNPCNIGLPTARNRDFLNFLNAKSGQRMAMTEFNIESVKQNLKKNHPVIAFFSIGSTLKHAMIINGYCMSNDKTIGISKDKKIAANNVILSVINPAGQCKGCKMWMTYDVSNKKIVSLFDNSTY